jgi:hypothetical protein
MVATELTSSRPHVREAARVDLATAARSAALAWAAMWVLTGIGALVGALLPRLAPVGHPHPTLHGTAGDAVAIAVSNARVLSAPFLLALFGFPAHRRSRQLGDVLVAGLLAGNALRLGLALGADGQALLPYVPQLPVEWLAAALSAAAWLDLRTGPRTQTTIAYVAAVLALVAVAAVIETTCTPNVADRTRQGQVSLPTWALRAALPAPVREAGGGLPALGSCAGAGSRFKVASLPSPRCRSVPLGRLTGAAGLRQPPPDPAKEGPQ